MKTVVATSVLFIILIWGIMTPALSQESGVIWIKYFRPGSADLNDPTIDRASLAFLDSLMKDDTIEVTFLGAADSLNWKIDGKHVHLYVSEALNDAKRLSRARALQARYGRGTVGITYENVAGVKVIWRKKPELIPDTAVLNELKARGQKIDRELVKIKDELQALKAHDGKQTPKEIVIKKSLNFNWHIQVGFWSWQTSDGRNIFTPSLAFNFNVNDWSLELKGGVTPWRKSSELGNLSESFVYAGIRFIPEEKYGVNVGVFRGWEFFTETDSWSSRTTGIATGVIWKYKKIEINPALTVSNVNSLVESSKWRVGSAISINFNLN